jgi:enamine deaminase RidA (YjgF/YER057c/UK114 family)
VGGQISADRLGRSIAPGRVAEQTVNTLEYIRHVLLDAKAQWEHVTALKVAHKWTADTDASRALAEQILREVARVFPGDKPALTMLGVDLLYEGLVLEIDALAVHGAKAPVRPAGSAQWHDLAADYPAGWVAGNEVYLGAHCAPAHGTSVDQFQETLARLAATLQAAGATPRDLVKINVFYTAEDDGADDARRMTAELERFLAPGRTVVSMVRTAGLLLPGQRVQIDGVAVMGQP